MIAHLPGWIFALATARLAVAAIQDAHRSGMARVTAAERRAPR